MYLLRPLRVILITQIKSSLSRTEAKVYKELLKKKNWFITIERKIEWNIPAFIFYVINKSYILTRHGHLAVMTAKGSKLEQLKRCR